MGIYICFFFLAVGVPIILGMSGPGAADLVAAFSTCAMFTAFMLCGFQGEAETNILLEDMRVRLNKMIADHAPHLRQIPPDWSR